jgi:hypothetical protein
VIVNSWQEIIDIDHESPFGEERSVYRMEQEIIDILLSPIT